MRAKFFSKFVADRTAVLFLGVAVGTAMGFAFADNDGDVRPTALQSDAVSDQKADVERQRQPVSEYSRPISPELVKAVAAGDKIRVGVFGDSFGDGLWSGLYHQLPARDGFKVEKFSQQSTGFTRYASLNLETRLGEQLAAQRVDIAVISFGANDIQGVIHKGKYAALMSEGWKAEIGSRIARYVGKLRESGAVVYWVGLPVMRKPSYDADISAMNAFYAAQMDRLGVPFIDTRALSVDASGGYAAYLPDPETGQPRLMRANDGIHMSMNGYAHLTSGLAERIRGYAKVVRAQAGTPPVSVRAGQGPSGA